jgi:uncharacterized protein
MPRLDDATIDRLDQYLAEHAEPAGGLPDSEALDGFLCAVVAGPEPILPSEWMASVWGPEHVFADEDTAKEMIGLLMRAYELVVARIRDPASTKGEPTDELLPLVAYPEFDPEDPGSVPDMDDTGYLVGALWAWGFALGRDLRRDAWAALIADWEDLDEALLDIDDLMLGLDEEDAGGDTEGDLPTLAERLNIVQSIPSLLHGLYVDAQQQAAPPAEPVRRESPKVGRNDPCPCGSGRKYKHCHGGN